MQDVNEKAHSGRRHPVVEEYWYSIDWDVAAIWALDLPVRDLSVAELEWHLDVPLWPLESELYCVTPRQVMSDPVRFGKEARRIAEADMSFPLDVIRHKDRWMILDGVHRLARAVSRGAATVRVRVVPKSSVRRLT